jgi:hypothetical protein
MRRRDFIACTAALALPGALRARTPARVLVVGDSMSAE